MGNYLEMLGQQLGTGAATNLLGTGMGLLLEGHNDRRQVRQQERLQELQMKGSKEMTDYNMAKQLEMWKATSYGAQVEQMNKAGINPALLYGMSGAGGTTTGNANGQVTGAEAPKGGREVLDAMGISMQAAQLSLLKAQRENIQADTNKKNTEANKTGGVDTTEAQTRITNIAQQTENLKAQKELIEIDVSLKQIEEHIKGKTQNMAISIINAQMQEEQEKLEILKNDRKISDQTYKDVIATIHAEMLGKYLQNELTKIQTAGGAQAIIQSMTNVKFNIIGGYIQRWKELEIAGRNSDTQRMKQIQDEWQNDIAQTTNLPLDIIEKALQAIIVKNILTPGQPARTPIGYK